MIVLDASILLYAYDSNSVKHEAARAWIEELLSSEVLVGIPWQTVSAFIRVVTHTGLPGRRFTTEDAVSVVDSWEAQPNVRFLSPGQEHWNILKRILLQGQARGPLVTDAQLAALSIEHGGELQTTDRDFARFPGLRWKNPLA